MSLNQVSDTEYEYVFPVGEFNQEHCIEFTVDGIEIEGDIITWESVFDARRAAEVACR
jgi:hypothetical protein